MGGRHRVSPFPSPIPAAERTRNTIRFDIPDVKAIHTDDGRQECSFSYLKIVVQRNTPSAADDRRPDRVTYSVLPAQTSGEGYHAWTGKDKLVFQFFAGSTPLSPSIDVPVQVWGRHNNSHALPGYGPEGVNVPFDDITHINLVGKELSFSHQE